MLGGGKAMMNAYYDTAAKLGVEIAYETEVREAENAVTGNLSPRWRFAMARPRESRRKPSSSPPADSKRISRG